MKVDLKYFQDKYIYVDKIIHQRLLFKEAQLKKFLNKYMDFLVNFEKLEVDDM